MAEIQPPHFLQEGCHTALGDRQVNSSYVCAEGVAFGANGGGDLEVVDGPSGMQVAVSSGNAFIQGDTVGWQGMYHVSNDANVNLTLAAADPTDPRRDLIIAQVKDSTYSGALDEWELMVVTGTPSPSPSTPATPASALALAYVTVAAGATSITASDITDLRAAYTACGAGEPEVVLILDSSTNFTKANHPGMRWARVICQGSGGAGGGSPATAAGESAVGSGGSAGEMRELTIALDDLAAVETVSISAGGLGVPNSDGGVGGPVSFGSWVTALGGAGGIAGTAGSTADAVEGAGPISGGTGGDVSKPGAASQPARRSATPAATYSSNGGDSNYGAGGRGRTTEGPGNDAEGYGAGGGGSKSGASSPGRTGGNGGEGVCIIYLT